MNSKLKNPYFYIGIIGVIFSSAGIDFSALNDWNLFWNALLDILKNPFALISVISALIGVYNDNSTKGLDIPITKNKKDNPTNNPSTN